MPTSANASPGGGGGHGHGAFDIGEKKAGGNALENLLTGGGHGGEAKDSGENAPKIFNNTEDMTEEERRFQEQEAQEQFFMELLRGKQTKIVRERLLRRLIFEQNFRREMKICCLFLLNIIMFMVIINMAYPSGMISPVHEYLVQHFGLPLDVNNLDELSEVLKSVAVKSRFFSPGSNLYTSDFYSNVYLPSPVKFPPQQLVPFKEQPKILPSMTITAWVKSTSRLDTIIEKQRVFSGGYQTCWRFGLEQVLYGLHEGPKAHDVVNPLAARVHVEGADEEAEWRVSASRRKYNTGTWHHWAITIENGIDFQFFADGISTTKAHGNYVLTDCPDGTVYIGSAKIETELQGISFYPRVLAQPEIVDVMEIGMPLANFLAARSPPLANPNQLDELSEWSNLKTIEDGAKETRLVENTNNVMRHFSAFMLHDSGLNTVTDETGSSSSSSGASSSGGHRRLSSTNSNDENFQSNSNYQNDRDFEEEENSRLLSISSSGLESKKSTNSIGNLEETSALSDLKYRNFNIKKDLVKKSKSEGSLRHLAGAAPAPGAGAGGVQVFSPKEQYQVLHTADWTQCVNVAHHNCELHMLYGTKRRLAGKFAKVMEDYGNIQSELSKWCTDNVGKQDGVNANYTYAECKQLIGGFKDHAELAYYKATSGSTSGGHRQLRTMSIVTSSHSISDKVKKVEVHSEDALSGKSIKSYKFEALDGTEDLKKIKLYNAPPPMMTSEISMSTTRRVLSKSSRKLAGGGAGGGGTTSLDAPDDTSFVYPVDSTFGLAMRCMELPNDVTDWVDNADQLAHDVTLTSEASSDDNTTSTHAGVNIFEGENSIFDLQKAVHFASPDSIFMPDKSVATVGGGSFVTLSKYNCTDFIGNMPTHEKHYLEHYALVYFRMEEYYQCTHNYDFMSQCQKDCGECGQEYAPSEYDVLDAIISCEDDMTFRDWDGKGCAWYYNHDPGCGTYGSASVKSACIATCGSCDPALKAITMFDLDYDKLIIYHEMNAFFVSAREPQHKVTLHNIKSMVVFLCCNKIFGKDSDFSNTCDRLEQDRLLYDDALLYMEKAFDSESESQYSDFLLHAHDSVKDWPYAKRTHIPKVFIDPCVHENFDNGGKMNFELLIGKYSGFRKAVDDGVATFETLQKETRPVYAIDQQHSLVAENFQTPRHMPNQKSMSMEQINYVFQECLVHSDCHIDDYANSAEVYPHACSLIEDSNELELLIAPKNCTRYDKRHYLFCSKKCLTGACGAQGDVEWGAMNSEYEGVTGWCQPCNGCINSTNEHGTFKSYTVDGQCPQDCAVDGQAVPEHHAADPLVIHTPNALGGWSVATWVKEFQYQWILRKQIHFDHDHPNHRWEGFTTKEIIIEHANMYLPPECQHIDGTYDVIMPLQSTGMLIHKNEYARLQFRHVGQNDYWQIISMKSSCVKSAWTPPGSGSRRNIRKLASAVAAAPSDHGHDDDESTSPTRVFDANTMKVLLSWQSTDREKPYQDPLPSGNALWLEDLTTGHDVYDAPHSIDELIRIHSKSGELVCWRIEVNQICFRNKWYERKLTCVENPLYHILANSNDWHHLVIAKKGEQWTEYDQAHNPPRPVYSDREDHIEFYVDGQKKVLGVGLQSGQNAVPPFGLPDCGGPLQTEAQIHAKAMDFYQGPQFTNFNKLHYADDIAKESIDSLKEFFPMYKVLPMGGNNVITAFTFEGVEIGKNAYLHESNLELCAADLISNYMFEDLNCITEGNSASQSTSTITFDIYGVTNVTSLSELEKLENPCYLFELLKTKSTVHHVEWRVSVAAWELDSIFGQASYSSGSKRRDGHHLCDKRTPDLNPILTELLEQGTWAWGESVTLMIVEAGKVDTSCNCDTDAMSDEIIPLADLENEMRLAQNGCEFIEHLRKPFNEKFGLFVQPFEDRYHPDGHLARLTVTWCLNSKCVSPQFLGGGSDVKYQGTDAISERLVYWLDHEEQYAIASGRNTSLTGEVCFSYIDGSEYDCQDRCPTNDYSHEWDIIGTFDCKNAQHQAAFDQAKAEMQAQAVSVARRLELLESMNGINDQKAVKDFKDETISRHFNNPYISEAFKYHVKKINDPELIKKRTSSSMPRKEYERLFSSKSLSDSNLSTSSRSLKAQKHAELGLGQYHEMPSVIGKRLNQHDINNDLNAMIRTKKNLHLNIPKVKSDRRNLAGGGGGAAQSSSAAEITALDIGELALQGIQPEGVVFDMRFVSRAVVGSEIQSLYNHESSIVMNLPGPALTIRRTDESSKMAIAQYRPELVSVIPPVILQVRIESQSCKEPSPGMADSLYTYLHKQLAIICEQSYMCQYPTATLQNVPDPALQSGYICRDRLKVIENEQYWEKSAIDVEGVGFAFPEFLDMYTQQMIFRKQVPHMVNEWIDAQTNDIVVLNVFYTPIDRLATVFKIEWLHHTSGKFVQTHDIVSFVQMNKDEQQVWIYCGIFHVLANILGIVVVLYVWNTRRLNRNAWYERMIIALESNISNRFRKDPNIRARVWQKVKAHIPLFHKADFADIIISIFFTANYVAHFSHYYSPNLTSTRVGLAEEKIQALLQIPWDSHDILYETKVQMFLDEVQELKSYNMMDVQLRYVAMILMIVAFIRIMYFLKVHPRVAVLYETLKLSASPLLHFSMVTALLIFQLGFIAFVNFGSEIPQYSSFVKGIYFFSLTMADQFVTQDHTHISTTYAVFLVLVIILVPIIIVNVARAIIINAFAMVNAKSRVFQPESNVFSDLYYCTIRWPIMRRIHGWKSNKELIEELFALELNTEITITELSSRQLMLDQHVLKAAKIFKTEEAAETFLKYFASVKDKLQVDADTNSYDEHERLLMDLVELHSYCNTLGNKSSSTQGKSDGSKYTGGGGDTADKKSAFLETDAMSGVQHQQQSADQISQQKAGTNEMMKELKKSLKQLTRHVVKKTRSSGSADQGSAGSAGSEDMNDLSSPMDSDDHDSPITSEDDDLDFNQGNNNNLKNKKRVASGSNDDNESDENEEEDIDNRLNV